VVEATEPRSTRATFAQWEPILLDAGFRFCMFDGLNRFYVAEEHAILGEQLSSPANTLDHPFRSIGDLRNQLEHERVVESWHELNRIYEQLVASYERLEAVHDETVSSYVRLEAIHEVTVSSYKRLEAVQGETLSSYKRLEAIHEDALKSYARQEEVVRELRSKRR
jgi:hypothetical protein